MFKNAKIVGSRVWSIIDGWGTIISSKQEENINYSIEVDFDNGTSLFFNSDGRLAKSDINPTIFWNEFKIPEKAFTEPLPKLEVDTKVIVWDTEFGKKYKRYFSHFDEEGRIYCFDGGSTSWNEEGVVRWKHWEIYDEEKSD